MASDQHNHRLASVISALDELQERRELSDSGRGRLRGLLSTPLEHFSGVQGGPAGGVSARSSGLIRQSSRLSGMPASHAKPILGLRISSFRAHLFCLFRLLLVISSINYSLSELNIDQLQLAAAAAVDADSLSDACC